MIGEIALQGESYVVVDVAGKKIRAYCARDYEAADPALAAFEEARAEAEQGLVDAQVWLYTDGRYIEVAWPSVS